MIDGRDRPPASDLDALWRRTLGQTRARVDRRGALAERRLLVHFTSDAQPVDVPGATVRRWEGRQVELSFDPRVTSAHGLIAHVASRFDVEDVHLDEPPIEEVIARFYALHAIDA